MSLSVIRKIMVGCGKCGTPFESETISVLNAVTDTDLLEKLKNLEMLKAKCPHCGGEGNITSLFVYHDPIRCNLWLVIPENYESRYLLIADIFNEIIEDYSKSLTESEKEKLFALPRKIMPLPVFLLKIDSPFVGGIGLGFIHFSPLPEINLDDIRSEKYLIDWEENQRRFSMVLINSNYPEAVNSLWRLVERNIHLDRIFIQADEVAYPQTPIGTYGVLDILISIGSTIILPVVLGVLSNVIYQAIIDRKKAKNSVQKALNSLPLNNPRRILYEEKLKLFKDDDVEHFACDDQACFVIRCKENKKEYRISGTFLELNEKLKYLRTHLLKRVTIPGNCHMCVHVANHYVDLQRNPAYGDVGNLVNSYDKIFSKDTRVKFVDYNYVNKMSNGMNACKKAKTEMEKGDYASAIEILEEHVKDGAVTLDIIYNYAICLFKVGRDAEASYMMEEVIIRSINLGSSSLAVEFDQFSQRRGDEIDHGDEGKGVAVPTGSCPGGLEDAIEPFQPCV